MKWFKRPAAVAGITTAVAGAAAAVALAAAGPGVPQTTEYGGGFFAGVVSASLRFCEGTDGDYYELLSHYQASPEDTDSSDPRFDGSMDLYLHQLIRAGDGDFGTDAGHIDGNVTWYAEETGRRTAGARVVGTLNAGDEEFLNGLGYIGGPRGISDGDAAAFGELPRGAIYTPFTFGNFFVAVYGEYGLSDGAAPAPASEDRGGIVQSFNCTGRYEPLVGGPAATSRMLKRVTAAPTAASRPFDEQPPADPAVLQEALDLP